MTTDTTTAAPLPQENAGGLGATFLEPGIRNTRLLEKAIRQRWPILPEYRQAILLRQTRIAVDPKSPNREAIAAARCIKDMESQNQTDEHQSIPKRHEHHHVASSMTAAEARKMLADIEERLGIERTDEGDRWLDNFSKQITANKPEH